jgi:hypothetical protein
MDPARLLDTARAGLTQELLASALADRAPTAARERALTAVNGVLAAGTGSMARLRQAPVRASRGPLPARRAVTSGLRLQVGRLLESNRLLQLSLVVVAAAVLGVLAHCVARLAVDAMLALGSVSVPARQESLVERALRVEGGRSGPGPRVLRVSERLRVPE